MILESLLIFYSVVSFLDTFITMTPSIITHKPIIFIVDSCSLNKNIPIIPAPAVPNPDHALYAMLRGIVLSAPINNVKDMPKQINIMEVGMTFVKPSDKFSIVVPVTSNIIAPNKNNAALT